VSNLVAHPSGADWRSAYLRAREREGRRLPDDVVAELPHVPASHPLAQEWRQRADSCTRFVSYLRDRVGTVRVVDVGCGNGWMANRIAEIDGLRVVGLDAVAEEIHQARRVFGSRARLEFVHAEVVDGNLPVEPPDVVLLASVIQYVPDPARLLRAMLASLRPGGEVHVFDSPIYRPTDVASARERTRAHYRGVGVPEMTQVYRHHSWDAFSALRFDLLYRPDSRRGRLERRLTRRPRSPFPWLRFRAERGRPSP
jgi:2-polyprenyl-3-methyl-5-hydroxy-6-metoxy-1,4-benzoquinol methylase